MKRYHINVLYSEDDDFYAASRAEKASHQRSPGVLHRVSYHQEG